MLASLDDVRLTGVGRDPDAGDRVQVRFTLVNASTGSRVWESDWTALRPKPYTFSRTIDRSRLSNEAIYRWRYKTRDAAGRSTLYSEAPACYLEVDGRRPADPVITSAQYPEDQIGGGVGQPGTFTFSSRSTDVVAYEYELDHDETFVRVDAGSDGKASLTPPAGFFTAGSHSITVWAFDNARGVSNTTYRFSVRFSGGDAYWHLDEGGGTVAADASGQGHDLTVLGPDVTWGVGPMQSVFAQRTDDAALRFTGVQPSRSFVSTDGPLVDLNPDPDGGPRGFTVSAFLLAESGDSQHRVALSQDGRRSAMFELGRQESRYCANGMTTCWSFTMDGVDDEPPHHAVSDRPVVPGEWVHLTGRYNADQKVLDLHVCPIGTPGQAPPADYGVPVLEDTTPYVGTEWVGAGPTRLGRGYYANYWDGMIDDARVYNKVLDMPRLRAICGGDLT
ncbi:hypothetical protein GCM10009751_24260 [Myceligenerans crystallogenes]|uniref:Concanavalin A-like lectin/glucanases superfamily protein n=1 Tax=Myceligenerans crystallogenes TaxID=316335 RepID=A0ABN2NE60_9MICO